MWQALIDKILRCYGFAYMHKVILKWLIYTFNCNTSASIICFENKFSKKKIDIHEKFKWKNCSSYWIVENLDKHYQNKKTQ